MSSNVKFKRITFKSNDLSLTFFCKPDVSLLITGILSILKPDVMATKRYSFQDDEKTIIDLDIVVEKEKNVPVSFFWNNIFWKIWNFKIG